MNKNMRRLEFITDIAAAICCGILLASGGIRTVLGLTIMLIWAIRQFIWTRTALKELEANNKKVEELIRSLNEKE